MISSTLGKINKQEGHTQNYNYMVSHIFLHIIDLCDQPPAVRASSDTEPSCCTDITGRSVLDWVILLNNPVATVIASTFNKQLL